MKRSTVFTVVALAVATLMVPVTWFFAQGRGVTPKEVVSHGGPVEDYVSLVDDLRKNGAIVEPAGDISQVFFSAPGRLVRVHGEDVQVYEYPDAAAADRDARGIAPDGDEVMSSDGAIVHVDWIDTPHFFKTGRLIVLYVGHHAAVLEALSASLGGQIAGQ